MFTEEINKVALSNKRIPTFDKVTTFPQETPVVKVCENEMLSARKWKKTLKILSKGCENELYVTCNIFLNYIKTKCARKIKKKVKITLKKHVKKYENRTEYNKNWPYIPDHPYRILIIGGSGSGKTNLLLNLIENQPDIDKIYLYAKDPYEAKYQYLIKIREKVGIDHHNDPRAYIEYSNDMRDVYKNINYYNPNKENKILIVFDDMIADMINNRRLDSIVTELFIRGRKLNISLVFIT